MKRGKRYEEMNKQVDRQKNYPLDDAIDLSKKLATAKFDETIEMHFWLGIDPRHSDQQIRSNVLLPNGLGKEVRVLVFAEGEDARIAEAAGADLIGDDEMIGRIQEGFLDFDATLAVPSIMKKVGRIARVLGPRGLMPSPKGESVVQPEDLGRAINELKAGRLEFRNDKTGNLHIPIGKASFEVDKLIGNAHAVVMTVQGLKPAAVKGNYIKRVVVTSTMGLGIRIDLTSLNALTA